MGYGSIQLAGRILGLLGVIQVAATSARSACSQTSPGLRRAPTLHRSLRLRPETRIVPKSGLLRGMKRLRAAAVDVESEPWELDAFSPSKINLFLRVVGKRPDGFHDLGSLFQAISLGDRLRISRLEEGAKDEFYCDMPGVPTDDSNLVLRAAKLFRDRTGIKSGVKMCLNKTVPAQGGLGGGSANAATTLWGLNKLFDFPATQEELINWSADLGSDITFFLSSGTAFCTGRGEILENVPHLPQKELFVIKPSKGLSTPLVFKNLNYSELSQEDPRSILRRFYTTTDSNCSDMYINDLEPPAFRLYPELKQIKDVLEEFKFEAVLMSGSGTSLFALGEPQSAPEEVFLAEMQKMKDDFGLKIHKARFVNRGPGLGDWYEPVTL
ncbi:hypothetical protein AAMO2058_000690600 [Amorphochlora amoebiformis]